MQWITNNFITFVDGVTFGLLLFTILGPRTRPSDDS